MTNARLLPIVLFVVGLVLPLPYALAQDLELDDESRLWIEGTSNRSDWTVHANALSGTASGLEGETLPSSLHVTVTSKEIKSDKSTIMDRLMHETLKVEEHPTITFDLTDIVESEGVLTATGNLTLVGVTNPITMDVQAETVGGGAVRYTGSTPLKMTDFEMRPPTAMFGALRTADDVTVHFDVTFVPAG